MTGPRWSDGSRVLPKRCIVRTQASRLFKPPSRIRFSATTLCLRSWSRKARAETPNTWARRRKWSSAAQSLSRACLSAFKEKICIELNKLWLGNSVFKTSIASLLQDRILSRQRSTTSLSTSPNFRTALGKNMHTPCCWISLRMCWVYPLSNAPLCWNKAVILSMKAVTWVLISAASRFSWSIARTNRSPSSPASASNASWTSCSWVSSSRYRRASWPDLSFFLFSAIFWHVIRNAGKYSNIRPKGVETDSNLCFAAFKLRILSPKPSVPLLADCVLTQSSNQSLKSALLLITWTMLSFPKQWLSISLSNTGSAA